MGKPRAAAYLRVSTAEQATDRNQSLAVQRERVRAYCARQGYELDAEYEDHLSGQRDSRRQYQALIEAALRGDVQVIVTQFLDRFGRNEREIMYQVLALERAGVRVACSEENVDDFLMLAIRAYIAGKDVQRLAERIRPTQFRATEKGRAMGCRPYGWDKTAELGLVVNESEAQIVRYLARLLTDEGLPLWRLTRRINDEGYRSPRGKRWDPESVKHLLQRERNIGIVRYGRPGTRRNPDGAKPSVTVSCPPILTAEQYAAVIARLGERRYLPAGRSQRSDFLLTGLIYCGECGYRMSASHGRADRGDKRYPRYSCQGHRRARTRCPGMTYVPCGPLEAAVREALLREVDAAAVAAAVPVTAPLRDFAAAIALTQAQLDAALHELHDNMRLYQNGRLDEVELGALNAVARTRRQEAERHLAQLACERQAAEQRRERVAALPRRTRSLLDDWTEATPAQRKTHLQQVLERITVYRDGRVELRWRGVE